MKLKLWQAQIKANNVMHFDTLAKHSPVNSEKYAALLFKLMKESEEFREDGSNIGGSGIHFPSAPGKYLADLRSRANSQQYSSIYED